MEKVEDNKYFKKAKKKASEILGNNQRITNLISQSVEKIKDVKTTGFVERLKVIIRLIKSYVRGEYRSVKIQNILLLIAAIVYFVTPVDLIPDFIPITGFIDDFTVVVWVYNKLQEEIDNYLEWESAQSRELT